MRSRYDPALLAISLCVAVVFALWPFQLRTPSYTVANGAWLDADGTFAFTSPGIVVDEEGGRLIYERLRDRTALTLAVVAQSGASDQEGPARIVSLSSDTMRRNFTLGQHLDGLIFRVRTPATGENGLVPGLLAQHAVRPGRREVFIATYDGSTVRLYAGGRLTGERALSGGPLAGWAPDDPLVFGNEATGDRPWLGRIADVALYDTSFDAARAIALTPADLALATPDRVYSLTERCPASAASQPDEAEGVAVGACRIPQVLHVRTPVELLSPKLRHASDVLHSLLVWLPVGFFLGRVLRRSSPVAILLALALPAIVLECAQVFVPARSSSLIDLLIALAAGWTGCLAGRYLASRRSRGAE